jgi:glycosyltransferase involved in cell wall biosynthesis
MAGKPRVALVHDFLNQMGGAERVLLALHDLFPDAPIYTTIAAPERLVPRLRACDIRVSFMQRLPGVLDHHQTYLPLYPTAVERMDLRDYDLVLSDSSAFAKAARARPGALHLCYCHTPMRFAWNFAHYAQSEQIAPLARATLPPLLARLRAWDRATAVRVDAFMANSPVVAGRIQACYGRAATVVPPPVAVDRCTVTPMRARLPYFLTLARLVPYKRIDLAVRACTELQLPLRIIGAGRDRARLERLAGPTVEFLGALPDAEVRHHLAHCRALLCPGVEDFGISAVEAQACGTPVIAFAGGGALTTVIPGQTGLLFYEQTAEALMQALAIFQPAMFDPALLRQHAEQFATPCFHDRVAAFIADALGAQVTAPRLRTA